MKASNIRRGNVVMFNGAPHRVMDFHHHTPGNLRAMVQLKLRNLLSGTQTETKVASTEDLEEADVITSRASFLYSDADGYHFMNSESYEQFTLSTEAVGESVYYLQDQMDVDLTLFNGDPIGLNLPQTVVLTIADTEPEMKGATASNSPKPAKTDTGLALTVPPFVKIGDRIVVNTENGTYLKRAE